jgi:hypothetical protein
MKYWLWILPACLAACGQRPLAPPRQAVPVAGPYLHGPLQIDDHAPPFAVGGWAPFTRDAAVAIAVREWRLWGQGVDDAPPDNRPPPLPEQKPERQQGLWQRVGEYWWEGQDPGTREAAFTGMHDENGVVFPAAQDGDYAWSAAFISYVMRIAGAGTRFAYAPSHSTYINAAAANATPAVHALPPQAYAPLPGDLICTGRATAANLRFADLPTAAPFPSHCDIVISTQPGRLTVLGGNVDDAVTEKHVPLTATGTLAGPDGVPLDTRYDWFVVLRIDYEAAAAPNPPQS